MMHNRQKKYQLLSVNRVEQSIISASGQLLFGLFSFGSMGLVIGQMIGQLAASVRLLLKLDLDAIFAFNRTHLLKALANFRRYQYLIRYGVPLFGAG